MDALEQAKADFVAWCRERNIKPGAPWAEVLRQVAEEGKSLGAAISEMQARLGKQRVFRRDQTTEERLATGPCWAKMTYTRKLSVDKDGNVKSSSAPCPCGEYKRGKQPNLCSCGHPAPSHYLAANGGNPELCGEPTPAGGALCTRSNGHSAMHVMGSTGWCSHKERGGSSVPCPRCKCIDDEVVAPVKVLASLIVLLGLHKDCTGGYTGNRNSCMVYYHVLDGKVSTLCGHLWGAEGVPAYQLIVEPNDYGLGWAKGHSFNEQVKANSPGQGLNQVPPKPKPRNSAALDTELIEAFDALRDRELMDSLGVDPNDVSGALGLVDTRKRTNGSYYSNYDVDWVDWHGVWMEE